MNEEIAQIINETVNSTIQILKAEGFLGKNKKTAFQKTEELLKNYNILKRSKEPTTKKMITKLNGALKEIKDDQYYEIITMTYFENQTREYIAEYFDTTTTTVTRNKNRLINKLKIMIFSDEAIREMFYK